VIGGIGGRVRAYSAVWAYGRIAGINYVLREEQLRRVGPPGGCRVVGRTHSQMYVGRASCIPSRDGRAKRRQAIRVGQLVAPKPGFAGCVFYIFGRIDTRGIAMPDVNLNVRYGSTAILTVVRIDVESQRNAALEVASIKVRPDIAASKSGGAVIHEVGAFLALGGYRARRIRGGGASGGSGRGGLASTAATEQCVGTSNRQNPDCLASTNFLSDTVRWQYFLLVDCAANNTSPFVYEWPQGVIGGPVGSDDEFSRRTTLPCSNWRKNRLLVREAV
jgi:hypothetical protein